MPGISVAFVELRMRRTVLSVVAYRMGVSGEQEERGLMRLNLSAPWLPQRSARMVTETAR